MAVPTYSIRQVSLETGLSADTLRYYERIGLLRPERHASSRQRIYNEDDLKGIGFLLRLRSTGMPLEGIREYIRLYRLGDSTFLERGALLAAHEAAVRTRIADWQVALEAIREKRRFYDQKREKMNQEKP